MAKLLTTMRCIDRHQIRAHGDVAITGIRVLSTTTGVRFWCRSVAEDERASRARRTSGTRLDQGASLHRLCTAVRCRTVHLCTCVSCTDK